MINRLKVATWLIIPVSVIVGIVEHNMREARIKENYRIIQNEEGTSPEKIAVQDLVKGCGMGKKVSFLPQYLGKRLFGNCRTLEGESLVKANFRDANLRNAYLILASLRNADLTDANLTDTILIGADLRNTILILADLRNTLLSLADLRNTLLSLADLRNADLGNANLRDANLIDANLTDANLTDANLTDAKNLTNQQIKSACNWQQALFKAEWNNEEQKYIAIEPDNSNIIEEIEQDKESDPKIKPDCSRWE